VSQAQRKDSSEELITRLIHRVARATGAFRSTTQALLNGADEDPMLRRELLQDMEFELGELQRLLENVTQLKALERGTFVLSRREVLMGPWLRLVVGRWQRAAPDKGLAWVVDIPEELPDLRVDVDKLELAFNNLLGNAVRHTTPGARIWVRAWTAAGALHVRVASGQPRLGPEDYERLTDMFYIGAVQGRFPTGVGLGLHVTRQLVEQHGGTMNVTPPTPQDDAVAFEVVVPAAVQTNGGWPKRRAEDRDASSDGRSRDGKDRAAWSNETKTH
jgi:signal transduction histidine kinase